MASVTKFTNFFPYQKLKHEGQFDDSKGIGRSRIGSFRLRPRRIFRLKVLSLRKLLRKKVRLLATKIMKRFKESQDHFGDLFAGNYMFLQINPTPLKCLQEKKSYNYAAGAAANYDNLASYYLKKIAQQSDFSKFV